MFMQTDIRTQAATPGGEVRGLDMYRAGADYFIFFAISLGMALRFTVTLMVLSRKKGSET